MLALSSNFDQSGGHGSHLIGLDTIIIFRGTLAPSNMACL